MSSKTSFLKVVNRCDNFRLRDSIEKFAEFRLSSSSTHNIGLIPPDVLAALEKANQAASSSGQNPIWEIKKNKLTEHTLVTFSSSLCTPEARSESLKILLEGWRDTGLFSNVISPRLWRGELYAVYIDPFGPRTEERLAFILERSACPLFGLVTYGTHMTMHTEDWRIWVPTRAKTKQTWPLFLDNSVAGGIPYGLSPFESLIKECAEEANLDDAHIRTYARPSGSVSYFFKSPKGYLQPEVQFVYDLFIPPGFETKIVPRPSDGEVESFQLEDLSSVMTKMHDGLFKPNCALVLVDFFIRHGLITPENDPNYLDIVTRLHRRFGYED